MRCLKRAAIRTRLAKAASLVIALSLFEVVLVGKIDEQETPVGIGVALLATAAVLYALTAAKVHYDVRVSWLWPALLVLKNIGRDTVIVYGVLVRRLAGERVADAYLDVPFDPGGDDPVSAARRALAVAGVSTSPNEIVLAVDAERRCLRVHVLAVSTAPRHSLEWPL